MAAPSSGFWIKFAASFGFLGYSRVVPGTAGSLGGVAIYLILLACGGGWVSTLTTSVILTVFAIWVSDKAEKIFGRKDPSKVVIDEVAGMLITLIAVPLDWKLLLAGFVLFRLFDIVKIAPARQCEKLPGGVGIVLDDVVSGIYAWGALQGIILLTHL